MLCERVIAREISRRTAHVDQLQDVLDRIRVIVEELENLADINSLLIHELGHHYSGDHLASEYHEAPCLLGSKLTQLALKEPLLFYVRRLRAPRVLGIKTGYCGSPVAMFL